jgi:CRISPR-associated protein Csb1
MSDNKTTLDPARLLDPKGPIALLIRQELSPVDELERVIFPPTYPMPHQKGRVQRFEQGEYRVSIELPPDSMRDRDEAKENQKPGYQIDRLPGGANICEIDSVQSQANRIEPQFKEIESGALVPKIEISAGGETVNLLDAGHRAADAIVRMSSLAPDFHQAWQAAKRGDLAPLAELAPTSIVFGAWDSRSSQFKLQRLVKAYIRATNVQELTRSAQYTPALNYAESGAVDRGVEAGEGEKNNLSQEGMKHALNTRSAGGVKLTASSTLARTVCVNVAAIRKLKAPGERGARLRAYILGLTLVAALSTPDLDLREGCILRTKGMPSQKLIYNETPENTPEEEARLDPEETTQFALAAAMRFFAGNFGSKDRRGIFESRVADRYLAMSKGDRDKVRALGPITEDTLRRFEDRKKNPFETVKRELKAAREVIGKKPSRNAPPAANAPALATLRKALEDLQSSPALNESETEVARSLTNICTQGSDAHAALKEIASKIMELEKARKANPPEAEGFAEANA